MSFTHHGLQEMEMEGNEFFTLWNGANGVELDDTLNWL